MRIEKLINGVAPTTIFLKEVKCFPLSPTCVCNTVVARQSAVFYFTIVYVKCGASDVRILILKK